MKTAAIIALAGLATVASAQSAHIMLTHDDADSTINVGESVTWTLSVAFTGGQVASGGNMVISGAALGSSSAMAYTPTNGGNNGGSSNGSGIGFVNWTNSLLFEAFGQGAADRSNPFVVGTFGFTATGEGILTYSIAKGQASSALVSVAPDAFNDILFDDVGAAGLSFEVQTLNIVPTPASAALLGLGGLVAVRRRR